MSIWSELAKFTQISPAIWVDPVKATKELQESDKDNLPTSPFEKSMFPGFPETKHGFGEASNQLP